MVFFACLIPLVCHNVYRVCYVWGGLVPGQVLYITPNFPTSNVLSTLGNVDHVANQASEVELRHIDYGVWHKM
jgi:GMP synthase (glutamine-hydrolysing)